jgi:DHA1 family multidrug resistance protein-like MFS transporter
MEVDEGAFMNKKSFLIIFYLFIQSVIHNLGHPVTPSFVSGLSIPDYMFGLFFAAMSFGLMIGAPIWGILSDQGRRKLWITLGLSMYTIGQIGFGYAGNQTWMVIFRLFSGLGVVSAITIFTAIMVEQTPSKERAKMLAFMAASSTLGASLGYYLGGFFATNPTMVELLHMENLSTMFLIQAILNALYTLFIVITLKDVKVRFSFQQKPSMIQGLKSITKIDVQLLIFLISVTLMNMAATNLSKYIDVYFIELGYSEQDLGTYVMITGIVSLFASIFLVRLATKFKRQLLLIAFMNIISSIIVFIVFRSYYFITMMYTVYLLYVIFKTLYIPLEQAYIAKEAKEGQYGSIMGLRQSFVSLGMVLGPVIGGFLYDRSPLYLFDFNAILFLLGVSLLFIVMSIERSRLRTIQKANDFLQNQIDES